jgi:hypothetical protein
LCVSGRGSSVGHAGQLNAWPSLHTYRMAGTGRDPTARGSTPRRRTSPASVPLVMAGDIRVRYHDGARTNGHRPTVTPRHWATNLSVRFHVEHSHHERHCDRERVSNMPNWEPQIRLNRQIQALTDDGRDDPDAVSLPPAGDQRWTAQLVLAQESSASVPIGRIPDVPDGPVTSLDHRQNTGPPKHVSICPRDLQDADQ